MTPRCEKYLVALRATLGVPVDVVHDLDDAIVLRVHPMTKHKCFESFELLVTAQLILNDASSTS